VDDILSILYCVDEILSIIVGFNFVRPEDSQAGLPDFSWYVQYTKARKNIPNDYKIIKCP
jgi:hypothetical protein